MPLSLFIVEDHPIMRQVLCDIFEDEPDVRVCGCAASGEEALNLLQDAAPDVVLVDVSLPVMNGIELIQILHDRTPGLKCMMLSGHGEPTYIRRALDAGAVGYILKGDPFELPNAVQQVARGETYFSEPVRNKLPES